MKKKYSYNSLKKDISSNLWKRALSSIAGGNMLISKHPYRFSKNGWPTYFHKTKGCKIWDINKNIFHDFSYMGLELIHWVTLEKVMKSNLQDSIRKHVHIKLT